MEVVKVNQLINGINRQAFGQDAVANLDVTNVVAMGDYILSSEETKEKWFGALVDRIARTVISSRKYDAKMKDIVMSSFEFGAAIQKIYIELAEARENLSYEVENGTKLFDVEAHKADVKVKLFSNRDIWAYEITMPEYQINTAFTSAQELAAFVDAVFLMIDNAIEVAIENLTNICIANFMAEKLHYASENAGEGVHAVNLLKEYNEETSAGLTVANCLRNAEFLKYAGMRIREIMKKMEKMSTIFNVENYKRFTPAEDLKVMFLDRYASSNATYLESDTYHNELVALPGYQEVPYWQGQGTTSDFANCSKIALTTSKGNEVEQSGIIGFVFDRDALGVMFDKLRSATEISKKYDAVHYFFKAEKGYFNDLSENAVVFYIAEA